MKKIVIDARESGTTTGRYIDKLIEHLYQLKPKEEIVILTKPERIAFVQKVAPTFTAIETSYKEFTFDEQLAFKSQLINLNPDLVHFGMVQQPILYKGKVVTTVHDLTTVRFRNPDKNPLVFTIKQQVYKQVIRRAAHKSLIVITPTEYVKNDLVAFTHISPDKVAVTLEAADRILEPAVPLESVGSKRFIMYAGRPMPHKNLERLIQAFVIIQKQQPNLLLVLVGKKDNNYARIEQHTKTQGIKNVVFTDYVSDGQLRWLYEHCAAYVVPSLSEGFCLPGLEAMIHGAPVISSNATCLPEVYGDGAQYFDPLDVQAIAQSIEMILDDPTLRQSLVVAGKKRVEQFSWQRMASQTLEIYRQALQ